MLVWLGGVMVKALD